MSLSKATETENDIPQKDENWNITNITFGLPINSSKRLNG